MSADEVIARLRRKLAQVPGATPVPAGGAGYSRRRARRATRSINTRCKATTFERTQCVDAAIVAALQHSPILADVNTDQQQNGLETDLTIDRDTASRLGLTPARSTTRSTTPSASGRSRRSTTRSTNITWSWRSRRDTGKTRRRCKDIYVSTSGGIRERLADDAMRSPARWRPTQALAVAASSRRQRPARNARDQRARRTPARARLDRRRGQHEPGNDGAARRLRPFRAWARRRLSVNHQGHFVATTISFNLPPGASLSDARRRRSSRRWPRSTCPATIHGSFRAPRKVFQQSLASEPLLILAALRRSTSCSACSTRATSTASRSSPPCRRPASARCWR